MANVDKIIEDLIKGAARAGARVHLHDGKNHETKLALDHSTMLGGIPAIGPSLAALNAAAGEQSMGSGVLTGAGSGMGQLFGGAAGAGLGGLSGAAIARLLDGNPELGALIGSGVGGLGGMVGGGMLGAGGGRAVSQDQSKQSDDIAAFLGGGGGGMGEMPMGDVMGGMPPGGGPPAGMEGISPEVMALLEQLCGQMSGGHEAGPPAPAEDASGAPPFPPKKKAKGDDDKAEKKPPKSNDDKAEKKDDKEKEAALHVAYLRGATAATDRFKVAFIAPLLGMAARIGGGALAQKGLGAAAGRLGSGMLGRAAGAGARLLGGSGIGSQMAQAGAGELMGQATDRMMG